MTRTAYHHNIAGSSDHAASTPGAARQRVLAACAALISLYGCASYRAAPLDGNDVQIVLASPDRAVLAAAARDLRHPYLAPVALDFTKPLTPAGVAVLAVLANPGLRALRAREQVAQAQVFAAGLLPDPTLSLTVDHALHPATAATAYAGTLTLDLLAVLATRAIDQRIATTAAEQVSSTSRGRNG